MKLRHIPIAALLICAALLAQLPKPGTGGGGGSGSSSGGLVLVETQTASSSAQLDFASCITSSYDEYQFHLVNIVPATNNVELRMLMSTNGGSSYDTSALYDLASFDYRPAGSGVGGAASQASLYLAGAVVNTAAEGVVGTLTVFNPGSAVNYKRVQGSTYYSHNTNGLLGTMISSRYRNATAVNAVRFVLSSGNISSGVIRCYGVAK